MSDARALRRASLSLQCLPFRRAFYEALGRQALSSADLASRADAPHLLFVPAPVEQLEGHFIWLIQLGVLRREVDGQGLTERVRLTPLGRELLAGLGEEIPRAGLAARLREACRRHRPRW